MSAPRIDNQLSCHAAIRALAADGVGTCIEVGPGGVLAGLIRRIDRDLTTLSIADPEGLAKALEVLHG